MLHDFFDLAQVKLDVDVAQKAGEIVVAEIKDEIKGAFEAVVLRGFGSANLLQVDDVLVFEQLQDLDFAQRRDGKTLLFIFHQDFLESDQRPRLLVSGFEHFAESALTDFREFLILDGDVVAEGIIEGRLLDGGGRRRSGQSDDDG